MLITILKLNRRVLGFFAILSLFQAQLYASPPPIVFSSDYEPDVMGLRSFHPFANKAYHRIVEGLVESGFVTEELLYSPEAVSDSDLLLSHSSSFLAALQDSKVVLGWFEKFDSHRVTEKRLIRSVLDKYRSEIARRIVHSQRLGAGGTVLASQLALREGWAINLAGGYHHAHSDHGSGFCLIADVPIAIQKLFLEDPHSKSSVMIVDLDAHYGDGNAAAFPKGAGSRVKIFDVYNQNIFPNVDEDEIRAKIDYAFPIAARTGDEQYLELLRKQLPVAIDAEKPRMIFYNAGTDVYEHDPLGALSISREGIIARDELVFRLARESVIPIVMVLSGGYSSEVADVIAASILNLKEKHLFSNLPFEAGAFKTLGTGPFIKPEPRVQWAGVKRKRD